MKRCVFFGGSNKKCLLAFILGNMYNMPMLDWDPADMVEKLAAETTTLDDGDEAATARRIFKSHAPVAAMSIVQLAQYGKNENTRLRAAQYTVDRLLGTLNQVEGDGVSDPFMRFLKQVEAAANGAD